MQVINLFGAPSAGKSTTMLGLTYKMKMMGLSVENTPEFYKELILDGSYKSRFGGQVLVLAEQNRRLDRLLHSNDWAVTDCPLPLIAYYTPDGYVDGFQEFALNLYRNYDNAWNFFIERNHEFEVDNRIHSQKESDVINQKLKDYLNENGIEFKLMYSGPSLVDQIIDQIIGQLPRPKGRSL